MLQFMCKMCGGKIEVREGSTVAECEYCGTAQTLPKINSERRLILLEKANRLRRNYEFDKASQIYEKILLEDENDCEIYWLLVLCHYGIEYVEDPKTHKRLPTVHRAQFTSIYDDDNYKSAIKLANTYQRVIYEKEASTINEIQKGILAISDNEDPFDVFICYKETDEYGKRTIDSVLATDLYYLLKDEGFKVFFSRITLEDKLGVAYEPYIFAALNSSKVMVVLGTKADYFNAVWVKNEWSRFLSLIKSGKKKMLIPAYRDMDAYQLPKEFSHLQAQDMSKLGFMQDLIRGIKKIIGNNKNNNNVTTVTERVIVKEDAPDIAPLLRRAYIFLEDSEFDNADEYAEKVLDLCPECAEAYIVKLLVELRLNSAEELQLEDSPISKFSNYQKALRFASPEYKEQVVAYNDAIVKRIENQKNEEVYKLGVVQMNSRNYYEAIKIFTKIIDYKDSRQNIEDCKKLNEARQLEKTYQQGIDALKAYSYDVAAKIFSDIINYKDSKEKYEYCINIQEEIKNSQIYATALERVANEYADDVDLKKSISELNTILKYKDTEEKVEELTYRLEKWYEDKRKAEEEARLKYEREQEKIRIFKQKRKAFLIGFAKIGIPIIVAIIAILLLIFLLIVPLSNYNYAEKQFELGNYDEAKIYYEKNEDFLDSKKRLNFIEGYSYIDKSQLVSGISKILNADVPVKVTYCTNGGKLSNQTNAEEIYVHTYSVDSNFVGLHSFEKNGYHFINWEIKSKAYSNDVFEITLNAVWGVNEYKITYDLDGGEVAKENLNDYGVNDDSFTLVNPTKTGYEFVGWMGTDIETPSMNVTIEKGSIGDRSYKAIWQANTYVLHFNCEENIASVEVTYDQPYSLPIPSRVGYSFVCWKNNNMILDGIKWSYTFDVTAEAIWEANKYTVTFENIVDNKTFVTVTLKNYYIDNDTYEVVLNNGDNFDFPTNVVKQGYIFTGWYTDLACENRYNFSGSITDDLTLYAGWTERNTSNVYSDTVIDASVYDSTSDTFRVDTTNTSSLNKKLVYVVANESGTHKIYYKNGSSYSSDATYIQIRNLTTDQIIKYEDTYNSTYYEYVSFDCNAGDVIEISVYKYYYGEYVYFYFSNFGSLNSTATVSCAIQEGFSFCEGSSYTETFTYGKQYKLPEILNESGTFTWYNGNDKVDNEGLWSIASNVTLTQGYNLLLNVNGGSVENTLYVVKYGAEYELPVPIKTGYTFDGWYSGGTKYDRGIWKTRANIQLYARWIANEYTITFNDVEFIKNYVTVTYDYNYAGSIATTRTLYNGQTLSYPVSPVRNGYAFAGWYEDHNCTTLYTFSETITDDITLYAKWTAISTSNAENMYIDIADYSISSNQMMFSTSASNSSNANYYYFTCYKTGSYTFYAKYLSGDFNISVYNVTQNKTVLSNTNLYFDKTVSASFNANAGDIIYVKLYNYGGKTINSTGSFYVVGASYPVSTAKASAPSEAKLFYNKNETYTVTVTYGEDYILLTPTKSGYTFLGWYYGDTKLEDGNWQFTNDISLTAKWEET